MIFRSLSLKSPDSVEDVTARFAAAIEPRRMRFFSREHKTFQGSLDGQRFKVTRIIHYRNSFLPVAYGRIEPGDQDTVVSIFMRPNLFGLGATIVWLFTLWSMWSSVRWDEVKVQGPHWGELAMLGGMSAFAIVLLTGSFLFEAWKYEESFRSIVGNIIRKPLDKRETPVRLFLKWVLLPIWVVIFVFAIVIAIVNSYDDRPPLPTYEVQDPKSPTVVSLRGLRGWGDKPDSWSCWISATGGEPTQNAGWPKDRIPANVRPTGMTWHSQPTWVEIRLSDGSHLKLTWNEREAQIARDTKARWHFLDPRYELVPAAKK